MTNNLSSTQIEVLTLAAGREDRRIFPMPERLKSPAVQGKVFDALVAKGYVDQSSGDAVINTEGFKAVGMDVAEVSDAPKLHRSGTKKALLIELLSRPEGVSLFNALVSAWRWKMLLDGGVCNSFDQIAHKENTPKKYISRVFRMNFLAPDIVEAIINGTAPRELTLQDIKAAAIPECWDKQRKMFGFEAV